MMCDKEGAEVRTKLKKKNVHNVCNITHIEKFPGKIMHVKEEKKQHKVQRNNSVIQRKF